MILVEHYTSRSENFAFNDGDTEFIYHVIEAPSGIAARNFVRAATSPVDPDTGLVRKTIATRPIGDLTVGIYECKVKYSKIENQIKLTIDASTEKMKVTKGKDIASFKVRALEEITMALADTNISANDTEMTVDDVGVLPDNLDFPFLVIIDEEQILVTGRPDDEVPDTLTIARGANETNQASHLIGATVTLLMPGPNFGGLINVGKDRVDGVDWHQRAMKLTLQWSSKWNTLSSTYVETVEGLGGKVNDADIALTINGQEYVFYRGEMVSLGGTFEDTSDGGANISLKFEVSRNGFISIGERDGTNNTWRSTIFKRGWHLGWIRTVQLQSNGIQIETPNSFHVSQPASDEDFYADFTAFEVFDTIIDDPEEEE